jgi:glucose-1-phosphate cytidylyltransferase
MQVVILAGGYGTRLAEETDLIPKPMVKIGELPILIHIMNYYASFGHTEFKIAAGYKCDIISSYFQSFKTSWSVRIEDTGLDVSTGGRINKVANYLDSNFLLTYGDGLGDIDLDALIKVHKKSRNLLTVTAVRPPARFGSMEISKNQVVRFDEKNPQDAGWINGGFFYCEKKVVELLTDLNEPLEGLPIKTLVGQGSMGAYEHHGWWHPMDTLRDKRVLNELWMQGNPPWVRTSK